MFRKLREWNRRRKEWHASHLAAWQGVSVHGPDGLSPFHHQCEAHLARELAAVGLSLTDRVVERPSGHEFIRARVSGSSITVWIHDDTAGVSGAGPEQRFEEWDYRRPEDLMAAFSQAVVRAARPVA